MINKRLLHFLSFVYFKRGQLKSHALNVAVRQQMLRHFYSMITLLLTLHTATTATLLATLPYESTLNNTKRSLQSILQHSHNKVRLNSIWYAGAASSHVVFRHGSSRKTQERRQKLWNLMVSAVHVRNQTLVRLLADASDSSSYLPKFGFQVPWLPRGRSQASPEMPSLELCFCSSDLHSFVFWCAPNHICSVQFLLPLSSQPMEKQTDLRFFCFFQIFPTRIT